MNAISESEKIKKEMLRIIIESQKDYYETQKLNLFSNFTELKPFIELRLESSYKFNDFKTYLKDTFFDDLKIFNKKIIEKYIEYNFFHYIDILKKEIFEELIQEKIRVSKEKILIIDKFYNKLNLTEIIENAEKISNSIKQDLKKESKKIIKDYLEKKDIFTEYKKIKILKKVSIKKEKKIKDYKENSLYKETFNITKQIINQEIKFAFEIKQKKIPQKDILSYFDVHPLIVKNNFFIDEINKKLKEKNSDKYIDKNIFKSVLNKIMYTKTNKELFQSLINSFYKIYKDNELLQKIENDFQKGNSIIKMIFSLLLIMKVYYLKENYQFFQSDLERKLKVCRRTLVYARNKWLGKSKVEKNEIRLISEFLYEVSERWLKNI